MGETGFKILIFVIPVYATKINNLQAVLSTRCVYIQ